MQIGSMYFIVMYFIVGDSDFFVHAYPITGVVVPVNHGEAAAGNLKADHVARFKVIADVAHIAGEVADFAFLQKLCFVGIVIAGPNAAFC